MSAEVVEKLRKRYQCSVCSKSWSSRASAATHVERCAADPASRACKTCRHDDWDEAPRYGCARDLRPGDVSIVFACPGWEPKSWPRVGDVSTTPAAQ